MRSRTPRLALSAALALLAISLTFIVPAGMFAATSTTTASTTSTTTTCDEGRWPARVQGQPTTFAAGARAGDYIWHDANGWHLRFTHPGTTRIIFSGTVVSNAPLTVKGYRLESGDSFSLSADHKTLTYRFANYGRIDGLDVRTACASRLAFKGLMAGLKLPVGRIWVGRAGNHPLQNPFVVLR
jgi:hypothetical protein